jgi:hypothetical protein
MEPVPTKTKTLQEIRAMNKADLLNYVYINHLAHGHLWILYLLQELKMNKEPSLLIRYLKETDTPTTITNFSLPRPIPELTRIEQKKKHKRLAKTIKQITRYINKRKKADLKKETEDDTDEYQLLSDS